MYLRINYTLPSANVAPKNWYVAFQDPDDVDNLYSEKKYYEVYSDHSDTNGFGDIEFVKLFINQTATSRAIFLYDENIDTFSLVSGNWEIDAGSCTAQQLAGANSLNLTWYISPSWNAVEEYDVEIEILVADDEFRDRDISPQQPDVITTLITTVIECTDADNPDRVSVGVNSQVDFTVRYIDNPASGAPSDDYPPDAEFTSISVYVLENNNEGTDATITNGAGSVSFNEASVQS